LCLCGSTRVPFPICVAEPSLSPILHISMTSFVAHFLLCTQTNTIACLLFAHVAMYELLLRYSTVDEGTGVRCVRW
jgi:hypothetical protein